MSPSQAGLGARAASAPASKPTASPTPATFAAPLAAQRTEQGVLCAHLSFGFFLSALPDLERPAVLSHPLAPGVTDDFKHKNTFTECLGI